MKTKSITFIAPVLFFFLFLIDAQITNLFENVFHDQLFAVSELLFIALLLSTTSLSRGFLILVTLVIGFLMDSYFTGVLGINLIVLPLSMHYLKKFQDTINQNIFTQLFGLIIFVTVYQVATAAIQGIFHLATIDVVAFISQLLGPTLILNILLFFVVVFPLQKLFIPKWKK